MPLNQSPLVTLQIQDALLLVLVFVTQGAIAHAQDVVVVVAVLVVVLALMAQNLVAREAIQGRLKAVRAQIMPREVVIQALLVR